MQKNVSKIYPQKWVRLLILLGFCAGLYFVNLGQWDLWNPDEPRYAQVAKEIVKGGDWILLHMNGKTYGDKPPLFFWLIGLSSYLWGDFTPFSVRFPSALFGTLTVILTFFMGRSLYTSRTGFLSGLILATSVEFAYLSTRGSIDATLTFFTTASLLCFFQWHRCRLLHPSPPPSGERERERGASAGHESLIRNLLIYGFYMSMALATLTKGPVGFILPLLVSLIYLLILKDWKGIKRMRLLSGMTLFLLVVLLWYLPAVARGGDAYLRETLFKHTVDAYAKGWTHVRPIYYYFYNFPLDFLPWFVFLPAAIAYAYSKEMNEKRKNSLFLLVWFVVIFVFFTLSKGKRAIYLLPLYPAASLMVGKLWDDFISGHMDSFRQEWISLPLYGFAGLVLVAGAAAPWVVSTRLPDYFPYSLPMAFVLTVGGLALFVFYRFKKYGTVLFLIVIMIAVGFFYTLRVVFPLVNPFKSARFISQEVNSRIQPGEKLGLYGGWGPGPYNFYTGIVPIVELEKKEDLLHFLQSSERVFCLLTFRDFRSFQTKEGWPEVQLIDRRGVGGNDMVLISNR